MTKLQSSKICCVDQMNHFVQDLFLYTDWSIGDFKKLVDII